MKLKNSAIFLYLAFSGAIFAGDEYASKEQIINKYISSHESPYNVFEVTKETIEIDSLDANSDGLSDLYIVDPNLCGAEKGCYGYLYLCIQGVDTCQKYCEYGQVYEYKLKDKSNVYKCKT